MGTDLRVIAALSDQTTVINFYDTAPGLKDLLSSSSSWNEEPSIMGDEETSVLPSRRALRQVRGSRRKDAVEEEDEEEEEDSDDETEDEEDEEDEAEEESEQEDEELPPSRARRAFRTSM